MRKYVMAGSIAIGICVGAVIWFSSLAQLSNASQQEKPKRPILSELPPIKNCTEHIKLVKAEFEMRGDSQVAALELENIAYIGVISISLDQAVREGRNSVIKDGFSPDKPPEIVMLPREKKILRLGNLEGNSPIRIGAAVFADGTEEGCAESLKTTHAVKDNNTKPRLPK